MQAANEGAEGPLDLVTGRVDLMWNSPVFLLPHVSLSRLRAFGVTGPARIAALPDVMTIAEGDLRGYELVGWQGILAPGKTPPEILARIQTETRRILFTPDVREKLSGQGAEPMGSSPAETEDFMRRERERWSQLKRDTHYKL